MSNVGLVSTGLASDAKDGSVYSRIAWRVMPMLFIGYIIAYMDRVNVGFAKLQMLGDLKFSETIYGLGAGVFFIGYFIFEVPSNLILHKVGARIWICRVMVIWGVVSAMTAFVRTPGEFYMARALLGIAEAGFFPGMVLYLTYWFPSHRRGKMMALLMAGNPVSGIIGGPLSGTIMAKFAGAYGYAGWQWMFILEAIPAIILGVVIFFFLEDRVADARGLTAEEKAFVAGEIEAEARVKVHTGTLATLLNPRIWLMCLILFGIIMGSYGYGFWQPTIIRQTGVASPLTIGLLTVIPYTVALVAMILVGRHADKTRERRWHVVGPALFAAVGFILLSRAGGSTVLSMAALSMVAAGIICALPMFWALPTSYLGGYGAAAGIALINCTANLAGFVSPSLIGLLKDLTGTINSGLYMMAATLTISSILILTLVPARTVNR